MAQGGQGDTVLETITVTAQFREQNLQQTPIAITAFNADMMNARSQSSVYEVSAQAPSVTLKPQGAAFGPSLGASIRGIGQFDFNPAYEPGVGMYVDDVYYPTLTGSIFDLLDLDRVEILRGPQGTLAGKNSIGGAVKLYSKKPEGDGTGMAEITYGSRNRVDLRANADFAITENLFARIAGVSKKQDGYVDRLDYGCVFPDSGVPRQMSAGTNCVLAKEGEIDYDGVRAMLRWDNGGPIEVNIIGDYTHDSHTQAATVLTYADYPLSSDSAVEQFVKGHNIDPYTPDPFAGLSGVAPGDLPTSPQPIPYDSRFICGKYCNYASYMSPADSLVTANPTTGEYSAIAQDTRIADGRSEYRGWGLSGTIDWDLSDTLSLKSITAYRTYDSAFSNDDDVSPLAHSYGNGTLDFWSFSQELRLNGAFGPNNDVEWTLGGFYIDQRSTYASLQDLRYAGLPAFYQDDPVDADSKAAFVHANWYVTDRLNLIGGLRYTDESKTYHFSRSNPDGSPHPVLGALDGQVGEYSGDKIDYRVSLQYQLTDAIMTYIQTATGFKGGGVNPRPFFASQVQPFDPEKLTSYEVGFKGEFFNRIMRLNGAAFFSDYTDIQLGANSCDEFSPFPGAPCALPINAGDAHIKGLELETTVDPMEGLTIDASMSFLDFNYQRIGSSVGGIELTDVAPYTPKWKWSAGVQYEILLANAGTVTPRFDISYQDDVFTNATNGPLSRIENYYLANARLTWRSEDTSWEASLAVTNLFDKYYYLTKFDLTGAGAGFVSGQPGHPREWALTVKKYF